METMKKALFFLIYFSIINLIFCQTFVDIDADLHNLEIGDVEWGDYDNDGDLDVLISGVNDIDDYRFIVYRNDSNENFVNINANIEDIKGTVSWGDYDNDNDLDILIAGLCNFNEIMTKIYRNDGSDNFVDIELNLTQIRGDAKWGDFDNDNDLDVLIAGITGEYPDMEALIIFFENVEGNFIEVDPQIPSQFGSVSVGDYNNDDYLDFAISGPTDISCDNYASRIYRNDGNFIFTDIDADIPPLVNGTSHDWGDYDNDSDLDLIIAGQISEPPFEPFCAIYNNTGNDTFIIDSINIITPLKNPQVIWGDYDFDGDLDFLFSGEVSVFNYATKLFNNQNGEFIETDININIGGAIDFGDFDNDDDLDLLILGRKDNLQPNTKIYRNDLISSDFSINHLSNSVSFYPNPANKELFVEGVQVGEIEIMNMQGRVICNENVLEPKNIIDISKLTSGVYLIKVQTDNGIFIKKLIKQ